MKVIVLNQESEQKQQTKQPSAIPPFHQRFNIEFGASEAEQRFLNRVSNSLPAFIRAVKDGKDQSILWKLANKLGRSFGPNDDYDDYLGSEFYSCLETLDATYEVLPDDLKSVFADFVAGILSGSEVDLGVQLREGHFWPSGAKLLDEALVNENLQWLSDPKYANVLAPFEKGLRHFLEASKQPERLIDTVRDMYEALEKMARIVCHNNRNLGANADLLISELGLSIHYSEMLKRYTKYAHEFRHAVEEGKERALPATQEVEAFIYTTGLFIRLAIQQLDTK